MAFHCGATGGWFLKRPLTTSEQRRRFAVIRISSGEKGGNREGSLPSLNQIDGLIVFTYAYCTGQIPRWMQMALSSPERILRRMAGRCRTAAALVVDKKIAAELGVMATILDEMARDERVALVTRRHRPLFAEGARLKLRNRRPAYEAF
jgi:hypothetical protein